MRGDDVSATITRYMRSSVATAATAAAGATTIRCDGMAGGLVAVAGASTSATRLAIHGSNDGATFAPLYGTDGAAAEIVLNTAVDASYTLPDAAYGLRYMRLVSNAPLGTAATVIVTVKS